MGQQVLRYIVRDVYRSVRTDRKSELVVGAARCHRVQCLCSEQAYESR
jgi:hypothetical protein